jgi:hypothetical protein
MKQLGNIDHMKANLKGTKPDALLSVRVIAPVRSARLPIDSLAVRNVGAVVVP